MYPLPLLVLAAFSSYCYAQQAASDVVTSLDAITQSLTDATVLVNAVSSNEETEAMIEKYKAILTAESYFSNQNQASSTPAYTEAEQEQICSSLKTSTTQHTSLLDALSAQHDVFESTYIPVISALLKSDEDPTDAIFFQFVNMAPSCQETTKEGQDALVNKFSDVIAQYES